MRSEASYPGFRIPLFFSTLKVLLQNLPHVSRLTPYPNGVIADGKHLGNNTFSVRAERQLKPRVARLALQPWATRINFGVRVFPFPD